MARDEAHRRVSEAARDARSNDDGVDEPSWDEIMEGPKLNSELDEETLDERASTQMGEMWEGPRRYRDE